MSTKVCEEVVKVLREESGAVGVGSSSVSISKILAQIKRFQEKICKHIEDNYVNFIPNQTSSDLYLDEGERLVHEAEHLLQTSSADASVALQQANIELTACVNELREASLALRLSYRILKVDDLFQCVEEASTTKEYLVVLDVLSKLKCLILASENAGKDSDVDRLFAKCECYDTIKVKYHIQENLLKQNLQQRFDRLVQFTEKPFVQAKCVTLQVSKDANQVQDTAMALFQARYNPVKMCDFLMENCFVPLILKPVSLEFSEEHADYVQLTLSYTLKDLGKSLRPSYRQVFEHIKMLLYCLDNINVSVSDEQHVFTIIGDHIKARLLTLIVDECLMPAVPETMDEMHESTLVEEVLQFESMLADVFLINAETDRALSEFTERFDGYFRERFSRKILESAKEIMQKDLQDMTLVAAENNADDVASNPFLFPRCMVSKSALELIKLLERILRQPSCEGGDHNDSVNDSYLSCITIILHTYENVVPQLHEKLLESIPQQSALFHNNCMFLAQWVEKNLVTNTKASALELLALVQTLQGTGTKYLNEQIAYQQKLIMGILRNFDPTSDAHSLGSGPLKLIRQCLRQMDLLHNVWQNVLSDELYKKIMCQLLNGFIGELIRRIIFMEDISATVATELSELIDAIIEKAPSLFKAKSDVSHIELWLKLNHLKMILNASLLEITEQWCDGVGILTASFKVDEVKHLIRALFQNTDRRAKALTKIV